MRNVQSERFQLTRAVYISELVDIQDHPVREGEGEAIAARTW